MDNWGASRKTTGEEIAQWWDEKVSPALSRLFSGGKEKKQVPTDLGEALSWLEDYKRGKDTVSPRDKARYIQILTDKYGLLKEGDLGPLSAIADQRAADLAAPYSPGRTALTDSKSGSTLTSGGPSFSYESVPKGGKRTYQEGLISLQQALIDRGFDLGSDGADGYFGDKTKAAVSAFQRENGLEATGSIDDKTEALLRKKTNAGSLYGSGK